MRYIVFILMEVIVNLNLVQMYQDLSLDKLIVMLIYLDVLLMVLIAFQSLHVVVIQPQE